MPRARWKRSTSSKLRPEPKTTEPTPTTTAAMTTSRTRTSTAVTQQSGARTSTTTAQTAEAVKPGNSAQPRRYALSRSEHRGRRVAPPDLAQRVAHLADGGPRRERRTHRVEHVVGPLGGTAQLVEGPGDVVGGPVGAQCRQPLRLLLLDRRVDPHRPIAFVRLRHLLVDADDDPVTGLDLLRGAVGGLLDLVLLVAALEGRDRAAAVPDAHLHR